MNPAIIFIIFSFLALCIEVYEWLTKSESHNQKIHQAQGDRRL